MPWKIFKEGDEFCVYKHDADGNKVGDALGCHPSRAAARRQIGALHANVKESGGTMGNSETKTLVFVEALDLTEAQIDNEAQTVRQRIIRPGRSANGRVYTPDVLRRAVSLFEGVKTFADHQSGTERRESQEKRVKKIKR